MIYGDDENNTGNDANGVRVLRLVMTPPSMSRGNLSSRDRTGTFINSVVGAIYFVTTSTTYGGNQGTEQKKVE